MPAAHAPPPRSRKRRRRLLWGCLAIALLAALGLWAAGHWGLVRRVYTYSDRSVIREPRAGAGVRSVLWSIPHQVPDEDASQPEAAGALRPRRSSPGRILLVRNTADGRRDIFLREWTPSGWSAAEPIDTPALEVKPSSSSQPPGRKAAGEPAAALRSINSPYDEVTPFLTPDGTVLYFASNRPGGHGGYDLYRSRRTSEGWEAPRNLGGTVNSPYDDLGPAPHPGGSVLVFSTSRPLSFLRAAPASWTDVLLENWKSGRFRLAWCARDAGRDKWSSPAPVEGAPGDADARDPLFDPAGDFLYFASNREGGFGGYDIYRARAVLDPRAKGSVVRIAGTQNLGRPVNSPFDETGPALFLDGLAMAYTASDAASGSSLLLQTRVREVVGGLEFASLPLRAFARNLARLGLLLALAAVLAVLLFVAIRYRRIWQLSLLARCAIVAVTAHALMAYGFYFWIVGGEIVAFARKEAPREVTVEALLEARIALETRTADLAPEAELVRKVRPSPRGQPAPARPSTASRPAALVEDPQAPHSPLPLSGRLVTAARPAVEPPELTVDDLSEPLVALVQPPPKKTLAAPPARPAEPELAPAPKAPLRSMQAMQDKPRPGDIAMVEEIAARPAASTVHTPVTLARTQVQAPDAAEDLLPALARPVREQPPRPARLPVPAQAPRPAPAGADSAAAAAQPARPARLSPAVAKRLENAPRRLPTTELQTPGRRWRSPPLGLRPSKTPLSDSRLFREVAWEPKHRLVPEPGSRTKLPQALPRAAVSTQAEGAQAAGVTPRPARDLPASSGKLGAPAELQAPVTTLAAAPLTAPARTPEPVTAASPARLALQPDPGILALEAFESAAAVSVRRRRTLPEPGDAAASEATGSAQVADVLRPRPATRRERGAASPLKPPSAEVVAAPEPVLARAGASTLVSATLAGATAGMTAPASAAAPGGPSVKPSEAAQAVLLSKRLPEMPPDLRRRPSLRKVRTRSVREKLTRDMGGTDRSEQAVTLALQWLAQHQSPDGHWDVDHFDDACGGCKSPGYLVDCDSAVTSLALLCFLARNHTPVNAESPFRDRVARSIRWIVQQQDASGNLAGDDERYTMYSHGIATLALSEACILSQDKRLLEPLRKAALVIIASQNPTTGGWRYKARPPVRGDTSITGWQVLALKSLEGAGIEIPQEVFDRARHWLDVEVASGTHGGIYGYSSPREPRVAMVAEGMYARLLLGGRRTDPAIGEAARYIHTETRSGRLVDNLYLLYYGNLALFNYQGWIWEYWNAQVREFLVKSQRHGGTLAGSWNPNGPWSKQGGRVLSTCLATLTLEVYYRYLPLYWQSAAASNVDGENP